MFTFPRSVSRLMEMFSELPGVGPKSAQRLAFYVVSLPRERLLEWQEAFRDAREGLAVCQTCFAFSDQSPCSVCADPERDRGVICVVQDTRDVVALERMQAYRGLYHVLGGAISPMDGVGPDDLRLRELLMRTADEGVRELILATSSTVEGEATALYVARLTRTFDQLRVTRIAHGLPVGGELEYADDVTLARAFEHRHPM